jgi:hypothetical protein
MKAGVEVEWGLRTDGAKEFAESDVILHAVIPALNDFHRLVRFITKPLDKAARHRKTHAKA